MDFNNFKYHKSKVPADFIKKQAFFNELEKEFLAELNDPNFNDFFAPYTPEMVINFKQFYAQQKRRNAESYEYRINTERKITELKYLSEAQDALRMIKQKKLFNMQLQWRAGLIQIPDVYICYHFQVWANHIDDCPFIPPITQAEVDIMREYLLAGNEADYTNLSWTGQDYHEIMYIDSHGDRCYMPEWYEFYDNRMGTTTLLLLPNLKGEAEKNYLREASAHEQNQQKKNPPQKVQAYAPQPLLNCNFKTAYEFAKKYESDPHIIELTKLLMEEYSEESEEYSLWDDDQLADSIETLASAPYPIYLDGSMPWREAIIRGAIKHKNNFIVEDVQALYTHNLELEGIGLMGGEDASTLYSNDEFCKLIEGRILLGRKLLGEPENFDY